MAGHGGGGGGHGGGGGSRSSGIKIPAPSLPRNGCLRYLVLWAVALVLLLLGVFGTALRLVPSLPGLSAIVSSGGTASTQSRSLPAAPAAAQPASSQAVAAAGNSGTTSQGGGSSAVAPSAAISSAPLQSAQGTLITPYTEPAFYIVRPRDTLEGVAAMFGTSAAELRYYNGLTSDALLIGQVLYLPPTSYNPVPATGRNAGHDTQAPSTDNNGDQ